MSRQSSIVMEMLRALCVLAVVFLNFAHQAPAIARTLPTQTLALAASLDFCGAGETLPGGKGHVPCHACRLGAAADLPPTPAAVAMPSDHADVHYAAVWTGSAIERPRCDHLARAPPAGA
jgi:hypothetical protein